MGRSSRRLRTQYASSSEFLAEASAQLSTAAQPTSAAPDVTPLRATRSTRGNKLITASSGEAALSSELTPVVRLTRRRKTPTEPDSRSSSRQSSHPEEGMPAKKSRSANETTTRRTRNTPARATQSPTILSENRETRSTRTR